MSKYLIPVAVFIMALAAGYFGAVDLKSVDHKNKESLVELSSHQSPPQEPTHWRWYGEQPCPTKSEISNLFQKIKFDHGPEDLNCDLEARGSLIRTLAFAKSLKINLPKSWPELIRQDLENPIDYLERNVEKMKFDGTDSNFAAYNEYDRRWIHLGPRLFHSGPLDAIETLTHEARHSVLKEVGHVTCLKGDYANVSGACDDVFTLDPKTAGSYSYSVLLGLAFAYYTPQLSSAAKEYAQSTAITNLSSRFNRLDPIFGAYEDVVALIDDQNEVTLLNLSTMKAEKLGTDTIRKSGRIVTHVEPQYSQAGLLFFTDQNIPYFWSATYEKGKLQTYMDKLIVRLQINPRFIADVYVPYDNRQTKTLMQMRDGSLHFLSYNVGTKLNDLRPYRAVDARKPLVHLPTIREYFSALSGETIFLTQQNQAHIAPKFATAPAFGTPPSMQNNAWVRGSGGVYNDSLFMVAANGEVKSFRKIPSDSPDADEDVVEDLEWRAPRDIQDFAQGLAHEIFLTKTGKLLLRKRAATSQNEVELNLKLDSPIRRVIMTRRVRTPLAPD